MSNHPTAPQPDLDDANAGVRCIRNIICLLSLDEIAANAGAAVKPSTEKQMATLLSQCAADAQWAIGFLEKRAPAVESAWKAMSNNNGGARGLKRLNTLFDNGGGLGRYASSCAEGYSDYVAEKAAAMKGQSTVKPARISNGACIGLGVVFGVCIGIPALAPGAPAAAIAIIVNCT